MQVDSDILLFELRRKWCSPWCSPPQINMFNLISNCCNWVSKLQQPLRKVTVLVVGLDKAGKTSCVRGMLRAPMGEVVPTHSCVRNELRVETFLVNLLDMGGSPEVRGSWREYYGEAHGIIFVVDSSDRQRIKEVKELLTDMLRQPRVAGKPLLVLANKQDKMNALLGSELIEVLSLEKLVNQSRSLCHIEPCSALMDLRRWSDRKTLRGLRWLLRAVCLDYPELCARIIRDGRRPLGPEEKERKGKGEKSRKKNKDERIRSSKTDIRQVQDPLEKEMKSGSSLHPIRNILKKENSFTKKLKKKKKVKVKMKRKTVQKEGNNDDEEAGQEEEEADGNEAEHDHNGQKEKASSALLPRRRGKLKRKVKVKEEMLNHANSTENDDSKPTNGKGEKKKKKKVVKGKRKNKINTERIPAAYTQPADLSATFDLYRKAILALKARQDQELVPEQ
ncbi:ADP-ribosylation factor-like protein 13A [Salminus brasiliensis]|uniref:ADP-ribosylation factor-like protein 13A n=1 Tax=Salminus brasiliensis TaxID=930266 RepID=UPI003B83423C